MKLPLILLGLFAGASVLPIWRGAGHTRHDGVSLWQYAMEANAGVHGSPFAQPHIRVEEAIRRAMEAWRARQF